MKNMNVIKIKILLSLLLLALTASANRRIVSTYTPPSCILAISPSTTICAGGNTTLAITLNGSPLSDPGGTWSPTTGLSPTTGTTVTASPSATTTYTYTFGTAGCAWSVGSTLTVTVTVISGDITVTSPVNICIGNYTTLTASGASTYRWDPATGLNSTTSATVIANPTITTTYTVTGTSACVKTSTVTVTVDPCTKTCENCIGSFAPDNDTTFIVSAWVKKEAALPTDLTYTQPQIYIDFPSSSVGPFVGTGDIIDGWQRIEEKFTVPTSAASITIRLACTTGNCLFDDIRVYSANGSMKSYVYDPITLRLVAELDERNYATFYEYDEEGKLVRVKKETEKGVMTIKENKNSTKKK